MFIHLWFEDAPGFAQKMCKNLVSNIIFIICAEEFLLDSRMQVNIFFKQTQIELKIVN